jgi:HAE1 family hydrophobic/amphiphilic exporter-1
LSATEAIARDVSSRIRLYDDVVEATVTTIGADTQRTQNRAKIYVKLRPKTARDVSQFDLMAQLREDLAAVQGADVWVEEIGVMGRVVASAGVRMAPLMFTLRGDDLDELSTWAERLAADLNQRPGFVGLDSTFEKGKPEVQVQVDRDRAAALGVVTAALGQSLSALVGGVETSKLRSGGDEYPIRVRLAESARQRAEQVERLEVRATTGAAVQVGNVARVETGFGPSRIDRINRMRAVTVMGGLEEDMPLGAAVRVVRDVGAGMLPAGVSLEIEGMAKKMEESFDSMFFALFLAVIIIYMILASQFESFIHPFTIMMALPLSLPGALGALLITGRSLSLFAMIGIIMLMGLVTKNAILLVDYANILRRRDGLDRNAALLAAGPTRLRPILMTTAAMVFGMLPTALSQGYGAELRAPMAIGVIGGLLVSTLLTLVVVPVIYTLFDGLADRLARRRHAPPPAGEVAA